LPFPVPVSVPVVQPLPAPVVAEPVVLDAVTAPASPLVIVSGMSYALNAPNGADLGSQPGEIMIKLSGMALRSTMIQWQPQGVQFTAPRVDLVESVPATLAMVRADGSVQELPILFAPPQPTGSTNSLAASTTTGSTN
jgi:hypothetical protein